MSACLLPLILPGLLGALAAQPSAVVDTAVLAAEVEAVERAFARSMAERDHEAFVSFLAEDAVFFSGSGALRGRGAVAEGWAPFFEGERAPFSWEPATVEVLASGDLALSTGPVHDPGGALVSTFTSIWRRLEPGVWRIVFDKGNRVCPEQPEP